MKILFLIFISTASFTLAQWQRVDPFGSPINGINFISLDFIDSSEGWAATNRGTIVHTSDGGKTWESQTTGISVLIKKIRFADVLNGWAICDSGKIIHTTDGGNNWDLQLDESRITVQGLSVVNSQLCWITGKWLQQAILLKTIDGGVNWEIINPPLNPELTMDKIVFINENKGWFTFVKFTPPFYMSSGIYSTLDGGANWSLQFSNGSLSTDIFFMDENHGWLGGLQYLYNTTNGTNWTQINNIYLGHIHFIDPNVGWMVQKFPLNGDEYNKILVSSNGGTSFDIQYTGEWGNRIRDFKFVEQRFGWAAVEDIGSYLGGHLIHTTNGGGIFPSPVSLIFPVDSQFISSDSVDFNWTTSVPNITGYKLSISTDSLFASSLDSFVVDTSLQLLNLLPNEKYYWKVKALNSFGYGPCSNINYFITSLTDLEEDNHSLVDFGLSQNYPNPFNPSTKISWQSPVGSWQTLKLYDVLGNEVATLVNEYRNAGSYETEFNAEKLSSGVYYYQLRAGDPSAGSGQGFVETKKMIYLK